MPPSSPVSTSSESFSPSSPASGNKSNSFFATLPSLHSASSASQTGQAGPTKLNGKVAHDKDTVIFFDWDDTLLASSYLSSRGYRLDSAAVTDADVLSGLRELEQSVITVLTNAMQYGSVHIVTNAETGWVQLSAAKFIPAVVPLLNKITVVSARSTYENMFPDSPLKWKFYAFQERLSSVFSDSGAVGASRKSVVGSGKEKNILGFGDSHVEREAIRAVTRGFAATKTKSVKFAERPSLEQLRRQIDLVTNCFQYIHNHEGDLDLQLTVTVNNNNQTPQQAAAQAAAAHANTYGTANNVTTSAAREALGCTTPGGSPCTPPAQTSTKPLQFPTFPIAIAAQH